eukprot:SAG31_NODE_5079_length_2752_cov_4.966114_3_plen_54_part_01
MVIPGAKCSNRCPYKKTVVLLVARELVDLLNLVALDVLNLVIQVRRGRGGGEGG